MRRLGWQYESVRHSLAARGIRTGRGFFSKRRYFADDVGQPLTSKEVQQAVAAGMQEAKQEKEEEKRTGFRTAQTAQKEASAQRALEAVAEQRVVQERPVFRVRRAIEAGLSSVEIGGRDVQLKDAIRGLSGDERTSAVAAVNARAVKLAQAGVDVPQELAEFVSPMTKQQVAQVKRDRAKALESPFKREAKELGEEAVFGVVGAGELAVRGAGRAVGGVAKTTEEGIVAGGKAATVEGGRSGFSETNVLLGGNKKARGIAAPLGGLEGEESLSSTFDDLLGVVPSAERKSEDKAVQEEVEGLYGARGELSRVDESAYVAGDVAFKGGDREGLIRAINTLESQEQLLSDRFSLAEQTRAQVLHPKHRALAYLESGSLWGLSSSGGSKLAERTQKVAEVKRGLKDAANRLYARRKLLRYKLQRLDATVPPENAMPERPVRVLGGQSGLFGV